MQFQIFNVEHISQQFWYILYQFRFYIVFVLAFHYYKCMRMHWHFTPGAKSRVKYSHQNGFWMRHVAHQHHSISTKSIFLMNATTFWINCGFIVVNKVHRTLIEFTFMHLFNSSFKIHIKKNSMKMKPAGVHMHVCIVCKNAFICMCGNHVQTVFFSA